MSLPALHPIIPARQKRSSIVLHLFVVILAVTTLILRPDTARADTAVCTVTASGPTCPSYAPPALLNLDQALYAATDAQKTSLQNLEDQAVSNIVNGHELAAGDSDAVKSWGRADAEAQLYALLLQAINTSSSSRTTDQQNAVDWFKAVLQRQAVAAAQDAGQEYVKWAGLNMNTYQSLLSSNAGETDLQSFLSSPPQNYNLVGTNGVPLAPSQYALSTGGYCVYRSPVPDDTDYTGYNDPSCLGGCGISIICNPPTPSYDQFIKWGEADANYSLLSSGDYTPAARSIAIGMGVGVPLAAAVAAAPIASQVATNLARAANLDATEALVSGADGAESVADVADALSLTSGTAAIAVGVVITAIITAVLEGITVVNAAKLPGQLATLITDAEATPPDPATLAGSTSGATTLFSLFVGATLPTPSNQTCDNSAARVPPGVTILQGTLIYLNVTPCLNPTPIPPASSTDPQFLVHAKGDTTQAASPTISWTDKASGTQTTARLSDNWFIEQANGSTVQSLSITYTDWDGNEQRAWLLGDATNGYAFVTFSPPTDSSTTVDPSTCVANDLCSYGASIDYVGTDGQDYSASVRGYSPSTGSPSYSTAVEGSPVTFNANKFAPGSATGPITYTWQFQQAGCGIPCTSVVYNPDTYTITTGPAYTDPVSGDTATYTWQTNGSFQVQLTATDADGVQATDNFSVSVGDVPPTVRVSPDCAAVSSSPCDGRTGEAGQSMNLTGTVAHTGTLDNEKVTVNWGDGSTDSAPGGPNTLNYAGNPLTLTASSDHMSFAISDTHTYAKPGIYYGTVQASDWGGGTDSKTFTETVHGPQSISFASIPTHSYGDAPFPISATGGRSGLPVTFASTDTTVCTVAGATSGVDGSGNGTGNATVTVLTPGTCAITASQAGNAIYRSAPGVTRSFTVQPATLTVTASSPSITYGDTQPAVTPSYSGFVNNETVSVLTSPATCSITPNGGAAGTYATTCTGASAPNYNVTYVPGTLTINQAPLAVTANDKTMTYGGNVPAFDASYSGFLNGDTSSVISGLACGAVDSSKNPVSGSTPAGQYAITCAGGTATSYNLSYHPGTLTINKANTSVSLATAPAPSAFGQPVSITASIAVKSPGSGNPGGTVEFKDGGSDISGCVAQPVSTTTETATCTTSSLSVATHSITASYSGDANFVASSTSSPVSQTVNKAASTVTLAPSAPVTQGQQATFTAVAAAAAPGAGTPTGVVTFYDGTNALGTGQLSSTGGKDQATFSTGSLGVGAHTITASYSGDGNFATSTSAVITQYINTNLSGYPKLPSGAYNLSNANLSGASFVGVSLAGASLTGANVTNALFMGADLTGANLSNSNFMSNANFSNANLTNANLSNSNLKGTNFSGVNLSGANLTNSNLMGATGLKSATLTNVVWNKTGCPDGTNSSQDGGTCVGHL